MCRLCVNASQVSLALPDSREIKEEKVLKEWGDRRGSGAWTVWKVPLKLLVYKLIYRYFIILIYSHQQIEKKIGCDYWTLFQWGEVPGRQNQSPTPRKYRDSFTIAGQCFEMRKSGKSDNINTLIEKIRLNYQEETECAYGITEARHWCFLAWVR